MTPAESEAFDECLRSRTDPRSQPIRSTLARLRPGRRPAQHVRAAEGRRRARRVLVDLVLAAPRLARGAGPTACDTRGGSARGTHESRARRLSALPRATSSRATTPVPPAAHRVARCAPQLQLVPERSCVALLSALGRHALRLAARGTLSARLDLLRRALASALPGAPLPDRSHRRRRVGDADRLPAPDPIGS